MRYAISAILLLLILLSPRISTPVYGCHRYSDWRYPWPQKCYTSSVPRIPVYRVEHSDAYAEALVRPQPHPSMPPSRAQTPENPYPPEAIYKLKEELDALRPR